MSEDSTLTIARSAKIFLSGTFLSRATGMLRDVSMAFCFGAHPAIAAFMVAFRFSHLFRRLFGESALSSSFIPHFEKIRKESSEEGAKFFRDLSFSLFLLLSLIVCVCEVGLFSALKWGALSDSTKEIITLSMLMLPGVVFICLFALNAALLQCEKKFFLSSGAPALFNIFWILAVLLLNTHTPKEAALYLSFAVTIAFVVQWLSTLPASLKFLRKHLSLKECFKINPFSSHLKVLVRSFALTVLGVGAVQINSALDAVFARASSLEGPAYLWYAIRMEQLPLALFGIALASALLPPLSRAIEAADFSRYRELLGFALRKGFSLMLPCTMAIFVLGASSVNVLYGRGDFTSEAILHTTFCLWGYGLSLIPSCFVILLAPAFYAKKQYLIPTLASAFSVLINCLLNALFVFVFEWGAFAIAIGTSFAAAFNFYFLSYFLSKKVGSFFPRAVLLSFAKTTVCGLVAAGGTLLIGHFLIQDPTLSIVLGMPYAFPSSFLMQFLHFSVLTAIFGLLFLSYAFLLKLEDIPLLSRLRKA